MFDKKGFHDFAHNLWLQIKIRGHPPAGNRGAERVEGVAGPFPSQSPYPRVVAVVEHHYLPSQDVGAAVAHLQ